MLSGVAATGLATTLAGCSGGGDGTTTGDDSSGDGSDGGDSDGDDSDTESMDDTTSMDDTESMDDGTTTGSGSDGGSSSVTFDYTFGDSDDVTGSSLTGIAVDFPDGSSAVADVSLGNVTLGGGDVSRDVDSTSTSNNDTTYTIDFAGNENVESGDTLVLDLSNLDAPSGSYEATATVNPQSGGTEFTESFGG